LLIGALALFNTDRPSSTAGALPDSHNEEGIPYPEVPRLPLEEAKARFEAGTAIFVDVRSRGAYERAHIANAISLPLADLQARYRELPRDAEILTYCT
jgi:3-mercaptopyruvate sulfurtransferase SseA